MRNAHSSPPFSCNAQVEVSEEDLNAALGDQQLDGWGDQLEYDLVERVYNRGEYLMKKVSTRVKEWSYAHRERVTPSVHSTRL